MTSSDENKKLSLRRFNVGTTVFYYLGKNGMRTGMGSRQLLFRLVQKGIDAVQFSNSTQLFDSI